MTASRTGFLSLRRRRTESTASYALMASSSGRRHLLLEGERLVLARDYPPLSAKTQSTPETPGAPVLLARPEPQHHVRRDPTGA